ncbi:hypothetical protein [Aliikangiella maris]|uniref:Uncharacterized protein n=2 Tax=Aliikangiella maris TaxID=3162458 RepID=A0ABV2BX31_9GAMM
MTIVMTAYTSKESNVEIIGYDSYSTFSNALDLMGVKVGTMLGNTKLRLKLIT